eukprot:8198715-Alexandrium_andersonii.AAC.1
MRLHPASWKALIKRSRPENDRLVQHDYLATRLNRPGRGDLPPHAEPSQAHTCHLCERNFRSAKALTMHEVR